MNCDLNHIFAKLAKDVAITEQEEFVFTAENIPVPATEISTDRLVIRKTHHSYDAYTSARVDVLNFYAHKETYRQLGLCLLSTLFHSNLKQVKVKLLHPQSEIQALIFDHKTLDAGILGFDYNCHLTS